MKIFFIVFACTAIAAAQEVNNCLTDFWDCELMPGVPGSGKWTVAVLNGDAVERAIPSGLGIARSLKVDFSRNNDVREVTINTNVELEIVSVTGPNIEVIHIRGRKKVLRDVCIFTTTSLLPSLRTVSIDRAEILNFDNHQFQDCFRGRASDMERRGLKIIITNSEIKKDPTKTADNGLTFHRSETVNAIEMTNVSFPDLTSNDGLKFEEPAKIKAKTISFNRNSICGCDYNGNNFQCLTSGDDCDPIARPPFATTTNKPHTTTLRSGSSPSIPCLWLMAVLFATVKAL